MGFFNLFNPFKFSSKSNAAWNSLMAAYTFELLSSEIKQQLMDKIVEIESSALRRPVMFIEIVTHMSEAQLNHFYSLAMINIGIRPAIGNDLWFEVKNPHFELVNCEEIMAFTKLKLEKQFKVTFPDLAC